MDTGAPPVGKHLGSMQREQTEMAISQFLLGKGFNYIF